MRYAQQINESKRADRNGEFGLMKNSIKEVFSKPIHTTVANYIREQILSGALAPGDSISSEKQLCDKFGVSRGPVRQALDILVKEQLIIRSQGRGTFVSELANNRDSNLKGKDSLNIGVFFDSDFQSQWTGFFAEIIASLNAAADITYPQCKLSYQFHEQPLAFLNDTLATEAFDGYVFVPIEPECCRFIQENLPVRGKRMITFFREVKSAKISQFYIDQRDGAVKATDYLLRCGHRRIGILLVAPMRNRYDSYERMKGYQQAYQLHGLACPEELMVETALTQGGIRQGIDALTAQKATALLIGGQALINPVLRIIDQKGLKIPDDISLISFDDNSDAMLHVPSLSVVNQPLKLGAHLALDRLVTEINGAATEVVSIPLRPELILRESCKFLQVRSV